MKPKIPKKYLANASSVMIPFKRRNRKGRGMVSGDGKFAVEFKGVTIRCQTPEDAVRVARQLGQGIDSPEYQPWQVHEFVDFVTRLQILQRRFLAFLLERQRGPVTDSEIRTEFSLADNRVLAGVLSGVTKVAMALDIDAKRVYQMETKYSNGKPIRNYRLTYAFKQAAKDNDWPDKKDLQFPMEDED